LRLRRMQAPQENRRAGGKADANDQRPEQSEAVIKRHARQSVVFGKEPGNVAADPGVILVHQSVKRPFPPDLAKVGVEGVQAASRHDQQTFHRRSRLRVSCHTISGLAIPTIRCVQLDPDGLQSAGIKDSTPRMSLAPDWFSLGHGEASRRATSP